MPVKLNESVYQIKVTLRESKPPIWRRLLVSDSTTLYTLHKIIQAAMGWTDSHLHQFIIEGEYFSIPSSEDSRPIKDERRYRLNQITSSDNSKFIYEYDFGDSWEHEILVEKNQSPEAGIKYPMCIKGKRACPPEDIGGVWGYEEFLEAISDPNHDQHDFYTEWLGDEFDSEEFDIEEINQVLQRIK